MTKNEFTEIWNECSTTVADRFYPTRHTAAADGQPSKRRGIYLRDQAFLGALLIQRLTEEGVIQ